MLLEHNCIIIHSNSTMFKDVYKMDEHETVEEIVLWDRINSKNPGKTRTELLYNFRPAGIPASSQ